MFRRPVLPWIILTASLLLTVVVASMLSRSTQQRDDEAFQNASQATRDRIEARMNTYVALLRGTAGLISAEEGDVSFEAFNAYAERLRLPRYYPGIRGLGYSRRLPDQAAAEALVAAQQPHVPGYHLWPDSVGPERHAIVYLYPLDASNRLALGYDMHSQATRRVAMDRARDIGTATLSGRVELVQERGLGRRQPGFLLYVPIFRGGGEPPLTRAARREALIGYAYAAFRSGDMFQGIFGTEDQPRAAFRIYDGIRTDSSSLLFDSSDSGIAPARKPVRIGRMPLVVAGRAWTLTFAATESFADAGGSMTPLVIAGGIVLSLLLFGLAALQGRAERLSLQNERRFRILLESMPVAVTVADPDGNVSFRNARAETLAPGGAFFQHETHVPVPPEALPLARALKGERVEGDIFDLEAPDGTRRTVLASAFPVLAPENRLQMAVTAVVDVTDQKRAEERAAQLRRHTRELERSNRELQEFAYVASHDLQEPLRKISAFADLLRTDYGSVLDDEGGRYVNRIQDAALRMSQLIKGLLAFSRVSTHTRPFDEVDLNKVLEDVTQDLWARLQETGGALDVHNLPVLRADPLQMRQLFQNLIGNALKFHREGVPPIVHVRSARTHLLTPDGFGTTEGWALTVQDNGIGFDEKYAARIFAPFQRLHTRGEYEGTGIGLAIVRRIAERHGGSIRATSTPGEGTAFLIELPDTPPAAIED